MTKFTSATVWEAEVHICYSLGSGSVLDNLALCVLQFSMALSDQSAGQRIFLVTCATGSAPCSPLATILQFMTFVIPEEIRRMRTLLTSALSSLLLAVPALQAESRNGGWYVGVGAGMSSDDEAEFDVFNSSVNRSGTTFLEHGGTVSYTLMAGYKFASNVRLEGEFLGIPLDINDVNYTQLALPQDILDLFASLDDIVQGAGTFRYRGAVLNVFYDIDTGTKWVPYFGGGVGLLDLDLETQVTVLGETFSGSGSETTEIVQLQAGIDYNVSSRLAIFANYRWASIGDSSISNYAGTPDNPSTLDLDSYDIPNWQIGLKIKLGKR